MTRSGIQLARHYEVLIRLAKSEAMRVGDLSASLQEITEAAAHTLGIARVNIWLYDETRSKISCIEHYEPKTRDHTSGVELNACDYPLYFQALEEERAILAHDARTDPRTREFKEGYLDVLGITSMLDAPIRVGGSVVGIVCHEHIGPARVWTLEEQLFAGSLADMAALSLESSDRRQAEQALQQSELRTRGILANALDAIVIVDELSVVIDWNPRAEIVFGWSREEALGKTLYETVIPARDHVRHREGVRRFLATGEGPILNQRIEVMAVDKAGREFPMELSIAALRTGGSCVFSAFVRDITSRVRAEQEIHELNTRLEERVLERTGQLKTAADQKEHLLEQLRANSIDLVDKLRELQSKSEIIRKDLKRAQIIQRALLPSRPPRLDKVHVDALYRPGMNVGGDLYDVSHLPDGHIALYVADAMGHGVSAAMLSVLFKQRLEMCDADGQALPPAEVLTRVNQRLFDDVLAPGMFLTVAYVLLDPTTFELRAASAGHTPMLLLHDNEECNVLERTGPGLGIAKSPRFTEHRLKLRLGDRLVMYTDGLIDGIESRGTDGLRDLISTALARNGLDGPSQLRTLYEGAAERAQLNYNGDGADDVTLLMLEVGSGPSHLDHDSDAIQDFPKAIPPVPHEVAQVQPKCDELWGSEFESESYIACHGRGTWTLADAFRTRAEACLGAELNLHIDLTQCTVLDSTFLGTLHQIVASDTEHRVSLHGPNEVIHGLFEELGLQGVIDAICVNEFEPPDDQTLIPFESPTLESHQLLLRAHETLSQMNPKNQESFSGVIALLKRELEE